jgi:5-methylcytosine-specific restriction protein A
VTCNSASATDAVATTSRTATAVAAAASASATTNGRSGNVEGSTAQRGYGRAWQELRRVQLARQPYCDACEATTDLTVDHIVPLARGGRSEMSNLQTLCRSCNGSKAASY